MKALIRTLAIGAVLVAIFLVVRLIASPDPAPAPAARTPENRAAATPREPTSLDSPRAAPARPEKTVAPPEAEAVVHDAHGHQESEPNARLVESLNASPLSAAPHRVMRAWGGRPEKMYGPVGMRIVVSPSMSSPQLERLVRDLRTEYSDAILFSTHVYDDEEAATYDKHTDGGALAERHLVAKVVRDASLEEDTILIRGNPVEP